MRKKSHAKKIKVTITALALALVITCFVLKQPLSADTFTRADQTSLISMGSDGLVEMAVRGRSSARLTVIYHPNGGVGQTSEESVEADTEYTIKSQGYTKSRFFLYGWNSRPDGLGTSYVNGQVITITENIELYAMWRQQI